MPFLRKWRIKRAKAAYEKAVAANNAYAALHGWQFPVALAFQREVARAETNLINALYHKG